MNIGRMRSLGVMPQCAECRRIRPITLRQGHSRGQKIPRSRRYTVEEVAALTGYSVRTLRRHIAAGTLPVLRRNGAVFVTGEYARVWLGRELGPARGPVSPAFRCVPVRVYAAIAGQSMREVRHLIDKGALETVRRGGRVFVMIE
jgi:excisionase family DNA binding protein